MHKTIGVLVATFASGTLLSVCPGTSSAPGQEILELINEKRAAAGCGPLRGNDQLRVAAKRHAVDIRDHPGHYGPPGTKPPWHDIHQGTDGSYGGQRIAAAGYSPMTHWGEIIHWAGGPPDNTPQAAVTWWMGSPLHREKIENCAFQNIGIGLLYPGGKQWIAVVDFATH